MAHARRDLLNNILKQPPSQICGPECIPVLEKICNDLRETLVTWDPNLKGTEADKAAKLANDCKLFGTVLLHGFSLASCLGHHKTFPCAFSPDRLYSYLGQMLSCARDLSTSVVNVRTDDDMNIAVPSGKAYNCAGIIAAFCGSVAEVIDRKQALSTLEDPEALKPRSCLTELYCTLVMILLDGQIKAHGETPCKFTAQLVIEIAAALVGSTMQHKVLQLCNHCGRINRILQLSWSHPIIPSVEQDPSDEAKEFSLFTWFGRIHGTYPLEELEVRVAANAVLYCAYCALHTKLEAKQAFDTIQELALYTLAPAVLEEMGLLYLDALMHSQTEERETRSLIQLYGCVKLLGAQFREAMTRKLLDLRIMHTMHFAEWGSRKDTVTLATNAQEVLQAALSNWTREEWCGSFHRMVCIEFIPELGEDLNLIMDLLDCVSFNIHRLGSMHLWLKNGKEEARLAEPGTSTATDDSSPDLPGLSNELNPRMSKLLRLYTSLAVFLAKRDKGLYRRCYGQEFGLIAWCWNMNFESIMCHGELRDEHGPALRARTLDIVSRLVVVSDELCKSACLTRKQRGDLLLILYNHCRLFVTAVSSKKSPSRVRDISAQVMSELADRYLLLFRTIKHVSSNYDLPGTPNEIRDDDEDYAIGNILLDLDSMMTICRQQASSRPEDFIFFEKFPSPTAPKESKTYASQYHELISQKVKRAIKLDDLGEGQQPKI